MRVDEYQVLCDAVGQGVELGYARAHKHMDEPDEESIKSAIYDEVMNAITAYFRFEAANSDEEGWL